jgi:hypothetical protein
MAQRVQYTIVSHAAEPSPRRRHRTPREPPGPEPKADEVRGPARAAPCAGERTTNVSFGPDAVRRHRASHWLLRQRRDEPVRQDGSALRQPEPAARPRHDGSLVLELGQMRAPRSHQREVQVHVEAPHQLRDPRRRFAQPIADLGLRAAGCAREVLVGQDGGLSADSARGRTRGGLRSPTRRPSGRESPSRASRRPTPVPGGCSRHRRGLGYAGPAACR